MADVLKVFVSATSRDLRSYRQVVKQALLDHPDLDILPIVQEHFPVTHLEVVDKLREHLIGCDAVVCLVGLVYGGEPSAIPEGRTRRSYAQLEYDVARELKKPVFLLFAHDSYAHDQPSLDDAEQAALQRSYRDQLKTANQDYSEFVSALDLEKLIRRIRFPAKKKVAKPVNLPYDSLGTLFKGRDTFLQELHDRLTKPDSDSTIVRNAIHGLGGIGKTRAAVECAWRFAPEYSALLFVVADSPESLQRNMASLAGPMVLNLPERDEREEEAKYSAVVRWLEAHPDWFLILDNVDTKDAADAVEKFLPHLKAGYVVITTRLADWGASVEPLDLDVLAEEHATAFLLDRTARTRRKAASDAADAAVLVRHLDGLALALEQAGAFIAKQRITIADYTKRWMEGQERVRRWCDDRVMKYPRSVAVTWDTTMREVGDGGQALLRVLCWLAPDPIPRTLLEGEKSDAIFAKAYETASGMRDDSPITVDDALAELAAYSMVKFDKASGETFIIHRLVQEVMRENIASGKEKPWLLAALRFLRAAAIGDPADVRSWPRLEPLAPHLAAVVQPAAKLGIAAPTSDLTNLLAVLLMNKSVFAQAEPLFRLCLELDEKERGPNHETVSRDLNNLGQLLRNTNRFAEAEPFMRRALAITEAKHGSVHEYVSVRVTNLASLLKATNRLTEAEPLMRRALAIDEKLHGADHPNVAVGLSNLAQMLKTLGRHAEAEPMLDRAIAIDEKAFGPDHPKVAIRLSNLAEVLRATDRFAEAEPLVRRALVIDEKAYGVDHSKVATRLFNIAEVLRGTSRFTEAEECIRRALAIDEKTFGPDHSTVARDLKALARLIRDSERPAEAEPIIRRALAIDEQTFGTENPAIAGDLSTLGNILRDLKRPTEAEPVLERALAMDERSYGPTHPSVARDLSNLAEALVDLGRSEEALSLARRALTIDEETFGEEHSTVARDCHTLGKAFLAMEKFGEAEACLARSLKIRIAFHQRTGHPHPDLKETVADYRTLLSQTGGEPAAELAGLFTAR
jgi:tetratricopeptide (TPR) repeat protein